MTTSTPAVPDNTGPGSLDAAVLRIFATAGSPVGLGFLITDQLALTCAHVVDAALGIVDDAQSPVGALVEVDLPLLGSGQHATAAVVRWIPAQSSGAGDVAVLRLSAPPVGARPVRLVEVDQVWGHPARAYGLPDGRPGGVWHSSVLRHRQANGWVQADLVGEGYRVSPGFSGGPVWDDELAGVVGMVALAEAGHPPVSYLIPTSGLLEVWPELRTLALPPCPFRGLSPFQEADAGVFFGRRSESDHLARKLDDTQWVNIVGPSGCGKSSLAMAGVIPRRRRGGDCAVLVRPADGSSPLSALAAALLRELQPEQSKADQIAQIPRLVGSLTRPRGLADIVPQLVQRHGGTLLIVIDQFETLLELGQAAVDELAGVLFDDALPDSVRVLTTLRADFLEAALSHRRIGPFFSQERIYTLTPMRMEQIREIITMPLDAIRSVRYEEHLVERILADAGTEPGILPPLSFTLAELWNKKHGGLLTHRDYEQVGGVLGALRTRAEEAWEQVPPQERAAVRRLFTRLIRVPIGVAAATRRVAQRTELGEDEWRVAQQLAAAGLLVVGHSPDGIQTVELAHEALIGSWRELAAWAAQDREFLTWRESLRHDLERWERAKRAPDLLLTPAALDAAKQWLLRRPADLGEAERDYLRRGRAHRNARKRRRRAAIAVVCVLVLTAATAGVISVRAQQDAARKAAAINSASLAADAAAISTIQPGLAAQLAIAAYRTSPTQNAVTQLYATLNTPLIDRVIGVTHKTVLRVATQQHGPLAAAIDDDHALRIWNLAEPTAPALDATIHLQSEAVALAPRGGLLAGPCPTPGLCLWSLADPRRPVITATLPLPASVPRGGAGVSSMSISPDGAVLAAADEQGFTLMWSIAQPSHPRLFADLPNPTQEAGGALAAVAFAPSGSLLAQTIMGGSTRLWNISQPSAPVQVATISTGYQAVAFSPDGGLLAAVGDTNVGLWAVKDPAHPAPITVNDGDLLTDMQTLAFSPDGSQLAYNGTDTTDSQGRMCLLDLSPANLNTSGGPVSTCTVNDVGTSSMAYLPSGALLTGSPDGMVRLWQSPLPQVNNVFTYGDINWSLSPSGRQIAVPITQEGTGSSSSLGIWDIPASGNPTLTTTLPVSAQMVTFLSTTTLMTVDSGGAVQLWNLHAPHHPTKAASLSGTLQPAQASYAVSSDAAGDLVSVLGGDGLLHLWHVTGPSGAVQVGSIPASDPTIARSGVLPDGRTAFLITSAGINWWDISNPAHPVHSGLSPLKHVAADPARGNVEITDYADNAFVATTPPDTICSCATLGLWDVSAGHARAAHTLSNSVGEVVGLSDDGRLVAASGASKNTLTLWDTSDPQHPRTLASIGTVKDLSQIAFDPTDHYLAAAGSDGVQLWDISNPAAPVLEGSIVPSADTYSGGAVTFSPTGAILAVPGNSLYLYDADPTQLADRLCSYTGGTITIAQWQQYAPGLPYQNPCP